MLAGDRMTGSTLLRLQHASNPIWLIFTNTWKQVMMSKSLTRIHLPHHKKTHWSFFLTLSDAEVSRLSTWRMYVCCVHNKFNKCDPQKNSRIVIFAAATPTPHQIGRGAGEGLFLLKAFTLRRCIKQKVGYSTKSINLYLPWIVDGDEDKRKIIGWRWATWFDPPIKYIQTSDPPPHHCGLHIECCSCWTGW